jgi:hypothetical protein
VAAGPQIYVAAVMDRQIDLSRYHDLSRRIGVYSRDGRGHLSGDREDLELVDGEPLLDDGEEELARIAGIVDLFGPRSPDGKEPPSLGLVLQCAATIALTSDRLIVIGVADDIRTFVLPWDLVDVISMPLRRKITDRIAGNRTIELFAGLPLITLRIVPQHVADDEVMAMLARAAAWHRLRVSRPGEAGRLQSIFRGSYTHEGGNAEAWITASDTVGMSSHLRGRLVERDRMA